MLSSAPEPPAPPPAQQEAPEEPLVRAGLRGFLDLDRFDVIAVVALVLVAFGLRIASPIFPDFLSGTGGVHALALGYPFNSDPNACQQVPVGPGGSYVKECGYVFDEVYFPVDAAKDLHQPAISYFDPEPPLAKLLMAPPIAWWGFNTWTWRASTLLFGSLLVGLVYLIARRLRRDRFFALCAGLFMCLDGLAFVESRTGVIDIIAIFFVALFYYVFLLHWQARTRRQWRVTLLVMAAVAGLAFGAKLTALAPLVVAAALILGRGLSPYLAAGIPWLRRIAGPRRIETVMWRNAAGRGAILFYVAAGVVAAGVFLACYSRYLTVEHKDVYFFTSCSQGSTGLVGQPTTLPVPQIAGTSIPNPAQAIVNVITINRASIQYHAQECHSHPYSSHWYTWPANVHPVLFYYDEKGSGPVSAITNMGNLATWWLAMPALLFCVWRMTRGPSWWRAGVGGLLVISLVGMILLFFAAQRYHDPNNVSTSFTATQFLQRFHRVPTASDEIARVSPGPFFDVAFAGLVLSCVAATVSAVISRRFVPAFIVLGYITAWMMWVPGNERRVLFFYHALGMSIFAFLALAYALTAIRSISFSVGRTRVSLAPIAYGAVALTVASFLFFYPQWTAMPISYADHEMRIWIDTL